MFRPKASQTTKPDSNTAVDRSRGLGLWKVAVNATRGLFGAQFSSAGGSPLCPSRQSESDIDRRPSVRRSTSSPSLKHPSSSDNEFRQFSLNSRKQPHSLANLGRPIISPPSLPQRLQDLDSQSFNSKLAYPLTSVPSLPSLNSPFHTSSDFSNPCSPFDKPSSLTRSLQNFNSPRRRTKSVPGIILDPKALSLPDLTVDNGHPVISPFDSALDTPPTPPLETPKNPFDVLASPYKDTGSSSPRSISSVRRKPVPRYLYVDSTDDDHSDGIPPSSTSMTAPLLSSSELFRNALLHNQSNKKDLTLLPIGKVNAFHRPRSSGRGGPHRRSSSESARPNFSAPWSKQVVSQISAIREYSSSESDCEPLSPPPRQQTLPLPTPEDTPDYQRLSPCGSNYSRGGALSPLTDDEILAIRTFLRNHAVGQREILRRRRLGRATLQQNRVNSESSMDSISYDFHTDIVDSYLSGECDSVSAGSENLEDVTSRSTDFMSARANGNSGIALPGKLVPPFDGCEDEATVAFNFCDYGEGEECGSDGDDEVDSHEGSLMEKSEVEEPIDCNRATFGYYDFPFARSTGSPAKHMDANMDMNTHTFESDTGSYCISDKNARVLAPSISEQSQSCTAYSVDSEDMDFPGNDSEETAREVVSAAFQHQQHPSQRHRHQEDIGGQSRCESIEWSHAYARKELKGHHAVLRLVNCLTGAPSTASASTSSTREHDSYYGDDDEECEDLLLPSAPVINERRRSSYSLSGSDSQSQSSSTSLLQLANLNSDSKLGNELTIPVEANSFSGLNINHSVSNTDANAHAKTTNLLPLLSASELSALGFDSDLDVDIGRSTLRRAGSFGTVTDAGWLSSNANTLVFPGKESSQSRGAPFGGDLDKDIYGARISTDDGTHSGASSVSFYDGKYMQRHGEVTPNLPWIRYHGATSPIRQLTSSSFSIDLGRRTPSDPVPITVLRPPSLKSAIHHSRSSSTASQLHVVAPFLSSCAPSPRVAGTTADRPSTPKVHTQSITSNSYTPTQSCTAFTLGNSSMSPSTFRARTKKAQAETFECNGERSDYYGLVDEYGFTSRGSGEVDTSNEQGRLKTFVSVTACASTKAQTKLKRSTRHSVRQSLKHLFTRSKSLSSGTLGRSA